MCEELNFKLSLQKKRPDCGHLSVLKPYCLQSARDDFTPLTISCVFISTLHTTH